MNVNPEPDASSPLKLSAGFSRYLAVAEMLRNEILAGKYPLGSQLPPERELARRFKVAYQTVRQAMGVLEKRGMVARRQGHGTFVKAITEKLLIGLLIGPNLVQESAHFYRAIARAFETAGTERNFIYRIYSGLTGAKGDPLPPGSEVYERLRSDFCNHSFSGIIEFSPGIEGTDHIFEDMRIPRAKYEYTPDTDMIFDTYQMSYDSVKFLAARGRKDIAYISRGVTFRTDTTDLDGIFDAARELNLPTPRFEAILGEERFQIPEHEIFKQSMLMIKKWKAKGTGNRPTGIIVSDDIAMRAVAMALVYSNIQVPKDILVVASVNEGIDHHYEIPVARNELPTHAIASGLLDILERRIEGKPLPKLPLIIRSRLKKE